ncbi:FAD binding domain-containing protein [Cladophialophora immunda]|nr:FAD binding domain-containing protein [Cladophialophora immunda]
MDVDCPVFFRGEAGYEEARTKTVWNGLKPDRYPEVIVQAGSEQDVVRTVQYAAAHGMKIGIRSGGHSWSSSFLRQDGLLLDLSALNEASVDPETRTAVAGPGCFGGALNKQAAAFGLMFPGGHCPTVGLGGYLLQGGLGWNSRLTGLGCENVLGVDVVTAQGEIVHADAVSHPDLYWAARGSGHGFFAVVTRFYLQLHPLPGAMMHSRFFFPIVTLDRLLIQIEDLQDSFPRDLEVSLFIGHDQEGVPGLTILLRLDCLAATTADARSKLQAFHDVAIVKEAVQSFLFEPIDLATLVESIGDILELSGHRYKVDNVWMAAPIRSVLPGIHRMVRELAPAPSHLYLLYWGRDETNNRLPDMAFSLEAKVYISYFAIYCDSSQDEAYSHLVSSCMDSIAPQALGTQLGDENLAVRPSRFMTLEAYLRLEKIRQKYDPHARFHGFMGIPEEFKAPQALL